MRWDYPFEDDRWQALRSNCESTTHKRKEGRKAKMKNTYHLLNCLITYGLEYSSTHNIMEYLY